MNAQLQYRIEQFFYRKSELCDAQDWDTYIQLFAEHSEFHLPNGTPNMSTPATPSAKCR